MPATIRPRRPRRRTPRRSLARALAPAPWSPVARIALALGLALGVLGGGALLFDREQRINAQRRAAQYGLLERHDQERATRAAHDRVLSPLQ